MPGVRARLHALAFDVLEALAGGGAPDPGPLPATLTKAFAPHPTDPFSQELAEQARLAQSGGEELLAVDVVRKLQGARRTYLRRTAELAERQFRLDSAVSAWQACAEILPGAESGRALFRAASCQWQGGNAQAAAPLLERALSALRDAGDRRTEGIAIQMRANFFLETARGQEAEREFGEARRVIREVGDRPQEGLLIAALASLYREQGRIDESERLYEEALAIAHALEDRRLEGMVLGNLANLYQQTGRAAEARVAYEEALGIHREVGNRRSEAVTIGNLAILFATTGRAAQSEPLHLQALALHRELRNRRFEGIQLCDYACALVMLAKREEAQAAWREGAGILREMRDSQALELKRAGVLDACRRSGTPPFAESGGEVGP